MREYVQLTFNALTNNERDILIGRLSLLGFSGFEEKPKELIAVTSIEEYDEEAILREISQPFKKEILEEKNWNEEWEKNFKPVIVDNFCSIRAHFHEPVTGVIHDIVITPKMSFGTGHHATTFQMIRLMKNHDMLDASVCDFGTGTGVLAILAEKLGASNVVAIDNDEWSIRNAEENIHLNGCSRVSIVQNDKLSGYGSFDMILANINKNIILSQLPSMKQQLRKAGVLFLSGLLRDDFEQVNEQALINNMVVIEHTEKDKWIALALKSGDDI